MLICKKILGIFIVLKVFLRLKLYGQNKIEIEVKSYWRLFIDEVFNPFYVFQAFSITLWCFDHYFIYACCVFILTLFSIITALRQTRKVSIFGFISKQVLEI